MLLALTQQMWAHPPRPTCASSQHPALSSRGSAPPVVGRAVVTESSTLCCSAPSLRPASRLCPCFLVMHPPCDFTSPSTLCQLSRAPRCRLLIQPQDRFPHPPLPSGACAVLPAWKPLQPPNLGGACSFQNQPHRVPAQHLPQDSHSRGPSSLWVSRRHLEGSWGTRFRCEVDVPGVR